MARKRSRKKLEKRSGEVVARLRDLARRGEAERFLELAAERQRDLPAGELDGLWDEVLERACREALAAADLPRLERLLGRGRRGAPAPPAARLGGAVAALAAGRLAAAREQLASLAGAGLPPSLEGLLPGLGALAGGDVELPPDAPGEVRDLVALRRAVGRLASGEGSARRGSRQAAAPELKGPAARALWELIRGLATLAGGGDKIPTAAALEGLRESAASLVATLPGGSLPPKLQRLGGELELLAELAALERKHRRPSAKGPPAGLQLASGLTGSAGRRLEEILSGPLPPPALAPVRGALHRSWRRLLAAVARVEGSRGLTALLAMRPALLGADLELATPGEKATPAGRAAAIEDLDRGATARSLLAEGEWGELAQLLRSRSARKAEAGDLAALWSLELWVLGRWGQEEPEEGEEPPHHRAVRRLEEMGREIGRRFPEDSRGEVARALRDELVSLCEETFFCDHTLRAATALQISLPDDAGLLIAGLAAAVVAGEGRGRLRVEERLARRGRLREGEREAARRLLLQVALEDPGDLARVLGPVRPLFADEDWQEVRQGVAREMDGGFVGVLRDATELAAEGDEETAELVLGTARERAAALRPFLEGTPGFAAVELALAAWESPDGGGIKAAQSFAPTFGDLPDLLVAVRLLAAAWSPDSPPGVAAALSGLAPAVIGGLDGCWPLWLGEIPILALAASGRDLARLRRKLAALARTAEGGGREALADARAAVEEVALLKGRARPWGWRPPALEPPPAPDAGAAGRRRRKRRRRSAADAQLPLDFG